MEHHFKGMANHRRIEIIYLVANNKGITVEDISEKLSYNLKTISGHTQKLVQSGLMRKNYKGRTVTHELSPYGKIIFNFIRTFQTK